MVLRLPTSQDSIRSPASLPSGGRDRGKVSRLAVPQGAGSTRTQTSTAGSSQCLQADDGASLTRSQYVQTDRDARNCLQEAGGAERRAQS